MSYRNKFIILACFFASSIALPLHGDANEATPHPPLWFDQKVVSSLGNVKNRNANANANTNTRKKYNLRKVRRRLTTLIGSNNWDRIGNIISGSTVGDACGFATDISNDGRSVLVGCPLGGDAGSVHLYRLLSDEGGTLTDQWQRLNVTIAGENAGDSSGMSVSFASNSNSVFAVGEPAFDSSRGRVRVFKIGGTDDNPTLDPIGDPIKGNNQLDRFGIALDLSSDGTKIAVGASQQRPQANGAPGNYVGNGYVSIYELVANTWQRSGNDFVGSRFGERYGISVSLSGDGSKLGVGAIGDNLQNDTYAGRAELFNVTNRNILVNVTGDQQRERYGRSVAVSDDGTVFAVGATRYNCDNVNPVIASCGRVQIFNSDNGSRKGDDIEGAATDDRCGRSMDLSGDGNTIAFGCVKKAVVSSLNGNVWTEDKSVVEDRGTETFLGASVAISSDRQALIVGAPGRIDSNDVIGSALVFGDPDAASLSPSARPSLEPSLSPSSSQSPSSSETVMPSTSQAPSTLPTFIPSIVPTLSRSVAPTSSPLFTPTLSPSIVPSIMRLKTSSPSPTSLKTASPAPTSSKTASSPSASPSARDDPDPQPSPTSPSTQKGKGGKGKKGSTGGSPSKGKGSTKSRKDSKGNKGGGTASRTGKGKGKGSKKTQRLFSTGVQADSNSKKKSKEKGKKKSSKSNGSKKKSKGGKKKNKRGLR